MDIPDNIKDLFWEWDKTALDTEKHKSAIIERVINYGTLRDWRWLAATYGREEVRRVTRDRAASRPENIRPRAGHLAEILFG